MLLKMLVTFLIQVADPGDPVGFAIMMNSRDHAASADFCAVGNMGNERTGLRSHFAALDAEASVNAVGALAT